MLNQTLDALFRRFENSKPTDVSADQGNPKQLKLKRSNSPRKMAKKIEETTGNTLITKTKTGKFIARSVKCNMGYYVFGECSESSIALYDGTTDKNASFTLFVDCPAHNISIPSTEVTGSDNKNIVTSNKRSKNTVDVRHTTKRTNFRIPKVESLGIDGFNVKCDAENIHAIGDSVDIFQDCISDYLCGDTFRDSLNHYHHFPPDEEIFQPCNVQVPKQGENESLSGKPGAITPPPPPEKMDWDNYHRVDVIHDFMEQLEKEFPSLCSTDTIGQSIEGRHLKILKISNSVATNSSVWIDAGIHAREWIAPAVNTYIANYLARNWNKLPESITNKDWYFLPVINPDGYEYSHTDNRLWRKNRAWHAGECVGVDLNRNFSYQWGGRGSSNKPTHNFYKGPAPFSEPESNAIKEFMMNSGVQFKVYITLHSFGQVIIFPFASSILLCPDYIRLLQGATAMSRAIYETNGNTYKVGVSKDVMYPASGTSNDWCYATVGIPYCYLIELRSKEHKFIVPKEEIKETGNEILHSLMALMEFVDNNECEHKFKNRKK